MGSIFVPKLGMFRVKIKGLKHYQGSCVMLPETTVFYYLHKAVPCVLVNSKLQTLVKLLCLRVCIPNQNGLLYDSLKKLVLSDL